MGNFRCEIPRETSRQYLEGQHPFGLVVPDGFNGTAIPQDFFTRINANYKNGEIGLVKDGFSFGSIVVRSHQVKEAISCNIGGKEVMVKKNDWLMYPHVVFNRYYQNNSWGKVSGYLNDFREVCRYIKCNYDDAGIGAYLVGVGYLATALKRKYSELIFGDFKSIPEQYRQQIVSMCESCSKDFGGRRKLVEDDMGIVLVTPEWRRKHFGLSS